MFGMAALPLLCVLAVPLVPMFVPGPILPALPVGAVLPGLCESVVEPAFADAGGVVLPGDMPGLVSTGPVVEPFGAGEGVAAVCATAMPAEINSAAEASKIERMSVPFVVDQ